MESLQPALSRGALRAECLFLGCDPSSHCNFFVQLCDFGASLCFCLASRGYRQPMTGQAGLITGLFLAQDQAPTLFCLSWCRLRAEPPLPLSGPASRFSPLAAGSARDQAVSCDAIRRLARLPNSSLHQKVRTVGAGRECTQISFRGNSVHCVSVRVRSLSVA